MDQSYGTYVDDEYFDNHDYDDDTDDDTEDNTIDDTDDYIYHKEDSYTAAGAAPDAGAAPGSWPYMAGPPGKAIEVTGSQTIFWRGGGRGQYCIFPESGSLDWEEEGGGGRRRRRPDFTKI